MYCERSVHWRNRVKCWGCVRINCAVIARRQLFVNRKSRIHGPRKVDAMIFFFFIKMWKTSKMLCYIYSLFQLNERNSIFFRSLYTICIDNILSINENHDSQSCRINIARFKFIRKSNCFMQNIQGRYTNVQSVGRECVLLCLLVVGLSICILDLFLYQLSLIYAKFCNVIESRRQIRQIITLYQ